MRHVNFYNEWLSQRDLFSIASKTRNNERNFFEATA